MFFLFMILDGLCLRAQGKLNHSFRFNNGIYTSFDEFRDNKPKLDWDAVRSDLVVIEAVQRAKMGNLSRLQDSTQLEMDGIWGFSIKGIPYVRVDKPAKAGFQEFAQLRLRGRICYYEYEETLQVPVEVSAYNPLTGKPFRTQTIKKDKTVQRRVMLDFKTGQTAHFELDDVAEWIRPDAQLLKTFNDTPLEKRKQQLLKFLQIFNDRNPVQVE